MFGKKCTQCGKEIKRNFEYCPYCGKNPKSEYDQEDYGFLGKNDFTNKPQLPPFANKFMDKMFNSAMKLLEKQMKNINNELNHPRQQNKFPNNLNVQFFVNGQKVFPEHLEQVPMLHKQKQYKPKINQLNPEKIKKLSKLPRVEPKSKMKRLSGKIIYELYVPGVENIEDVLINQLENSIEIKALSDKKVYLKNLNINLPVLRYGLHNNNLIVEFQGD